LFRVSAGASTLVAGRNIGKPTGYYGGVTYKFNKKKATKMKKHKYKSALLALTLIGTIVSCDTEYKDETPSIAGIANQISATEGAAVQGGVVGVLSNSNPNHQTLQVFAPTNDAFAKLGLVDAGSLGAVKIVLTNTLLYHVLMVIYLQVK
jgi:uncharacterized surface protein with fasciclin (FAS1) repeats